MNANILLLLLQVQFTGLPDTVRIPSNPMLETIHNIKEAAVNVRKIDVLQYFNFLGLEDSDQKSKQDVIRSGGDTYICINGTGITYRLDNFESDSIVFVRVDETKYWGYNFNSLKFSHHDTLFSYGGNGFWRYQGALTFFDGSKKEWEIMKLNMEVPVNSELHFMDGTRGFLYFIVMPFHEKTTTVEHAETAAYKLDVSKKEVTKLGDVSDELSLNSITHKPYFESEFLNGLVIREGNEYWLLDFENNRISKLTNLEIANFMNGKVSNSVYYQFCVKDTLFNVYANGEIERRTLRTSDFTPQDERLYKEARFKPYLLLLAGLIPAALYIIRRRRRSPAVVNEGTHPENLKFTSLEWDIVRMMAQNHRQGRLTKSDEITHAMGLQKKSLDVQKKMRTEIIHRINHGFKTATNTDKDLVVRVKSEEDRRYIEYDISEDGIERLKQVQRSGPPPIA
jgi:hypothetical protein